MNGLAEIGIGGILIVTILKMVLEFLAKNSIENHLIEIKDLSLKQLKEIYKMNGKS